MLEITIKEIENAAVAYLRGEADSRTCSQLLRELVDVLETHPPRLVVVLDGVQFLDSRGLGALLSAYHRAVDHNCAFYVVSADPRIRKVMQITGLDGMMSLQPTEEEALSAGL